MKDSIDIHVGWRMRQRRWFLGMSLQEVSNQVSTNSQQLQKYESGANGISASRMGSEENVAELWFKSGE